MCSRNRAPFYVVAYHTGFAYRLVLLLIKKKKKVGEFGTALKCGKANWYDCRLLTSSDTSASS